MSGEHGRILVVDDTRINRTILAKALTTQGHEVVEAENGRAAMDLLEADAASGIDVVLLDLEMPEMDGYETLRRIKGADALAHLPVIVISANSETLNPFERRAVTSVLPKPFEVDALVAAVEAAAARDGAARV